MIKLLSLIIVFACFSFIALSQQRDYTAEEMEFLALVKKTPEYRHLKHEIDSVNKDTTQAPQDLSLTIIRSRVIADDNHNFLKAHLTRNIFMGSLESYDIVYDRNKRKIISFTKSGASAKTN